LSFCPERDGKGHFRKVDARIGDVCFCPHKRTSLVRPVRSEKCHFRTHLPALPARQAAS
jgi:hypothetical protein